MRDIRADWNRWTKAERITAISFLSALAVAVPSLLALAGLAA